MTRQARTFVWVWLALLVLLAITCGSAFVPLGTWNVVINYVVALAKTVLIVVFFMHLREAGSLLRVASVTGAVMLGILAGLTLLDALTRGGS